MAGVTEDREGPQVGPPQVPGQPPSQETGDAQYHPRPGSGLAVAAWLIIVLVEPVAVITATIIGYDIALSRQDTLYTLGTYQEPGMGVRLSLFLLWVGAPTVALCLAFLAARRGSIAGLIASAVSVLLLIATLALFASVGAIGWILVWVLVTGLLLFVIWPFGKKPSRSGSD